MGQILIEGARETLLPLAEADGDRLWIPLDELEQATGWTAKPEGMCREEVCVPMRAADWLDGPGQRLDYAAFAAHLGQALARDRARGAWSLGPPAGRGLAEGSAPVSAPDVHLPDVDGQTHTLSEFRGKKVLLYCWASW